MRTVKITLFLFFASLLSSTVLGQTNHPTISSVSVIYKSVEQSTSNNGAFDVIPEGTIQLNSSSNVAKIYFKILDQTTQAVIYEVDYPLNSSTVINQQGKKLFENQNGTIFISSGQIVSLKPYSYQVYTQDAQLNSSPVLSVIQ